MTCRIIKVLFRKFSIKLIIKVKFYLFNYKFNRDGDKMALVKYIQINLYYNHSIVDNTS